MIGPVVAIANGLFVAIKADVLAVHLSICCPERRQKTSKVLHVGQPLRMMRKVLRSSIF